jgi:hypothetical protein
MSYSAPFVPTLDWSGVTVLEQQIPNIKEMADIWVLYKKDIEGWHDLGRRVMLAKDLARAREYVLRAEHLAWACKILVNKVKVPWVQL